MKKTITTVLAAAVAAGMFFAGRECGRNADGGLGSYDGNGGGVITRVDTVVVRDTIRDTVLVPVERRIVRVDTMWLRMSHDTARAMGGRQTAHSGQVADGGRATDVGPTVDRGQVADGRQQTGGRQAADSARIAVPIEQKVYLTDDYRAVVEGFRPALVELELYPRSLRIARETTLTPRPRRWGIGVQAGCGITVKGTALYATPYIGIGVQYNFVTW